MRTRFEREDTKEKLTEDTPGINQQVRESWKWMQELQMQTQLDKQTNGYTKVLVYHISLPAFRLLCLCFSIEDFLIIIM